MFHVKHHYCASGSLRALMILWFGGKTGKGDRGVLAEWLVELKEIGHAGSKSARARR